LQVNRHEEDTAVKELIRSLGESVEGVMSGFDRIVFQGLIRPLMYPEGAMGFFCRRRIPFKDARDWVVARTRELTVAVDEWSRRECGEGITYLPSSSIRKEEVARKRQRREQISVGPIGAWACVEAGGSYRLQAAEGAPRLRHVDTRCKHLYIYLDHAEYGFMSIRVQTWLPYRIQVAMNGREWLSRQLEGKGIGFERWKNKIYRVEDVRIAQELLNEQLSTDWCSLLNSFLALAFPTMRSTLGPDLSYTWSLWQSEWASDVLFRNQADLEKAMTALVRHAFIGGHPERLLRYFGQPVKKNGEPRLDFGGSLNTRITRLDDGYRIRHWLGSNSVKVYNQLNVLRVESTINDPSKFRVHRRKQCAPKDAPKELLPLRKGVADTALRASVSQGINTRMADHLAACRSSQPLHAVLAPVTRRKRYGGRSIRALEPTGKDLPVLAAIADPRHTVNGFSNKELRTLLTGTHQHTGKTNKQQTAMTTRWIRLLRHHGVIRPLRAAPRRYQLTPSGRRLVIALQAALSASTEQLAELAA
jgi:hypothetical protein